MQKLNLINNRRRNGRSPLFKDAVAKSIESQAKFVVIHEFVELAKKRVTSFSH